MSAVNPVVRYLVLCEKVVIDRRREQPIMLVGLISTIRCTGEPPFPYLRKEMFAFLHLTGCRGPGVGQVEIEEADTGQIVSRTPEIELPFGQDPLKVFGASFRLRNCIFERPGLYWARFRYNGDDLARQSLVLR